MREAFDTKNLYWTIIVTIFHQLQQGSASQFISETALCNNGVGLFETLKQRVKTFATSCFTVWVTKLHKFSNWKGLSTILSLSWCSNLYAWNCLWYKKFHTLEILSWLFLIRFLFDFQLFFIHNSIGDELSTIQISSTSRLIFKCSSCLLFTCFSPVHLFQQFIKICRLFIHWKSCHDYSWFNIFLISNSYWFKILLVLNSPQFELLLLHNVWYFNVLHAFCPRAFHWYISFSNLFIEF